MEKHEIEWHTISDEVIERYVRFPETLTPELRHEIADLVERSEEARSIADFYRQCYARLDRLGSRSPRRLEQFLSSIFPIPSVAPLSSIASTGRPQSGVSVQAVPVTLPNGQNALYEPVVMLGSRATSTVVCLLRNREDGKLWKACVLTNDLLRRANTLISFTGIEMDAVVDHAGGADFTLPDEEMDVGLLNQALLRLPTVEMHVCEREIRARGGSASDHGVVTELGHVLRLEEENGEKVIWLDASGADYSYKYRRMVYTDGKGRVDVRRILPQGEPTRIRTAAGKFSVRLYE